MTSDILTTLMLLCLPFVLALIWSRYTASVALGRWLRRSAFYGAPLLIALIVAIKAITSNCTHQANFGFTECTTLSVSFANISMTAFVFALMLFAGYGLALFGVGAAIELQTRLAARR